MRSNHLRNLTLYHRQCVQVREDYTVFIQSKELMMFLKRCRRSHHFGILNPYLRYCLLVRENYNGFIQSRELMIFLKNENNCTAQLVVPT
jgi:hypothetical protein